jgi:hypothetical protein
LRATTTDPIGRAFEVRQADFDSSHEAIAWFRFLFRIEDRQNKEELRK